MKTLTLTLAVAALVALAGGQAFAQSTQAKPATLTIVMKDPGCHWFSVGGKLTTTTSVAGPVKIANYDEAALKIAGAGAVKKLAVGKTLVLTRGHYAITMVGKAPDDNHLKLTVR
jgi:hypothetical protein